MRVKGVDVGHVAQLEAQLGREVDRVARLSVAVRHLAAELHARHAADHHWIRCEDATCRLARKALEAGA